MEVGKVAELVVEEETALVEVRVILAAAVAEGPTRTSGPAPVHPWGSHHDR